MALTFDDIMFECIFDNTKKVLSKKKSQKLKKSSIKSKKSSSKLLNCDSKDFFKYKIKNIQTKKFINFYKDYKYINEEYKTFLKVEESTKKKMKII